MSTLLYRAADGAPIKLLPDGMAIPPLTPGEVALNIDGRVTQRDLGMIRVIDGQVMKQDRLDLTRNGADPADTDVLMICGLGQPQQWLENKCLLPMEVLAGAGVTMAGTILQDRNALRIMQVMETFSPRVVIVRGLIFDADLMRSLAEAYPAVQWCAICHSSQDYLMCSPRGHCTQQSMIAIARAHDNVWYATPNRTPLMELAECERWIYMPNVMPEVPQWRQRKLHEPLRVSLVSALRAMKCWPSQIIGAALAHRKNPLELQLCFERPEENHYWEQIQALCDVAGVPYRVHEWQDMTDYWRWLDREIDLGLQVSVTESFNYVAIEHMMHGIPVVASEAIRYAPENMMPVIDDPADIADVIRKTTDDYDARSVHAHKIAADVATEINRDFTGCVKELLAKGQLPIANCQLSIAEPTPDHLTADQFLSRTIASEALWIRLMNSLENGQGASVVRMGDGEAAYLRWLKNGARPDELGYPMNDPDWRIQYGVAGADPKEIAESILAAATEATWFAPSSSWHDPEYASFDCVNLTPLRDEYAPIWFAADWVGRERHREMLAQYPVCVLSRTATEDAAKLTEIITPITKLPNYHVIPVNLDGWETHAIVYHLATSCGARIALVCGGAGGKQLVTWLGKAGMVALDMGSSLRRDWLRR